MLMTTSSRCHLSPGAGRRLRIWLAKILAELQSPLPHGLVADQDASGGQHLLHHPEAQGKAEVQPHGMIDDLSWETVAGIARVTGVLHPSPMPRSGHPGV